MQRPIVFSRRHNRFAFSRIHDVRKYHQVFCPLVLLVILAAHSPQTTAWVSNTGPIRIDCGSSTDRTDATNGAGVIQWSSDAYYVNGSTRAIEPDYGAGGALSVIDFSLRNWLEGESCYFIPVTPGRYIVRLSFAYNNYDGNYYDLFPIQQLPSFGISINGTLVEMYQVTAANSSAYYTDYIAFSPSNSLDICLTPFIGTPFINSLQILPADTEAYFMDSTGADVVLSSWTRINSGSTSALGPETNGDPGYRTWSPDVPPSSAGSMGEDYTVISTTADISIPSQYASLNLPPSLFQTAKVANSASRVTGYNVTPIYPTDPSNQFLVVLYFAEIDQSVQLGDRVFNIWINEKVHSTVDILSVAQNYNTAVVLNFTVTAAGTASALDGQWIEIVLFQNDGSPKSLPMINGVEVYEIITTAEDFVPNTTPSVRIDCGASSPYTDQLSVQWVEDMGYSSGAVSVLPDSGVGFPFSYALRFFPYPLLNCYSVPMPSGRYLVRAFFDYGNYDMKNNPPTFRVSLSNVPLATISPTSPGGFLSAYLFHEGREEGVQMCLLGGREGASEGTMAPTLINALEILSVPSDMYFASSSLTPSSDPSLNSSLLFVYWQLNVGGDSFGDGLTTAGVNGEGGERGRRQWFADEGVSGVERTCSPYCAISAAPPLSSISNSDSPPNYIPAQLYETARLAIVVGGNQASMKYRISNLDFGAEILVLLHFAEIGSGVIAGQRVFSAFINGVPVAEVSNLDLIQKVGQFAAFDVRVPFKLRQTKNEIELEIVSSVGSSLGPILNGLEVMRVLQVGVRTQSSQVVSLYALRDSLRIPESLNWQGDPCGPITWKGISCDTAEGSGGSGSGSYYIVTQISLPNQKLSGSLSEAIGGLTDLAFLNLSGNAVVGPLPASLPLLPKVNTIDLSFNKLNGTISTKFGASTSLSSLYLNNNSFSGQFPQNLLNSQRGLVVSYYGNAYLCGAKGLPSCDTFSPPPPVVIIPNSPPVKSSAIPSRQLLKAAWLSIVWYLGCILVSFLVF